MTAKPTACLPVHWACTCGATGHYAEAYATDSANPDAKHQDDCTGTVTTSLHADRIANVARRWAGEVAAR